MPERNIAYITTTRADYGLMTPVLRAIDNSEKLNLQLYATGMHLLESRGMTVNQVRRDFPGSKTIDVKPEGGDEKAMARFCAELSQQMVEKLINARPEVLLLLGDRQEMLTIATVGYQLRIPMAHLHGGERTMTDDPARHAISKLSNIHLPATEESARRLIRMGEDPKRVCVVGAPALDAVLNSKLPSRKETLNYLGVSDNYILVTLHPTSGEEDQAEEQMKNVLKAVLKFEYPAVVIYPNIDAGGDKMIQIIEDKSGNELIHPFRNIPYQQYLAVEQNAVCWVGNSSAGLLESASFGVPVVNVGKRQEGRQSGDNVIHTLFDTRQIEDAVDRSLHDEEYLRKVKRCESPWGDGKTGPRVAKILEDVTLDSSLLNKTISF